MGVLARETPWVLRPKGWTEGHFRVLAKMAKNPYTPRYAGLAPRIPWRRGPNQSRNTPRVRASETRPAGHSGCPPLGWSGPGSPGLRVRARQVQEHRQQGHPNPDLPGRAGLYWATVNLWIVVQYSPTLRKRFRLAGKVELQLPATPCHGSLERECQWEVAHESNPPQRL